jgi:aconitate hydratase
VGLAKEVREAETARVAGGDPVGVRSELSAVYETLSANGKTVDKASTGIGSTIYAVKPGDGSAREQAASCQKVLGGWANIATEYATKRYRSNLINWGMLPFVIKKGDLPFERLDYIFIPGIRKAVEEKTAVITAYQVDVKGGKLNAFDLELGELTDEERQIILKGCLINYNRV